MVSLSASELLEHIEDIFPRHFIHDYDFNWFESVIIIHRAIHQYHPSHVRLIKSRSFKSFRVVNYYE